MNKELVIHTLANEAVFIKRKREHLLDATGERFNLISVLRLEYDEARLHTRLIADLLNPKGLHGQGLLFLRRFLKIIKFPFVENSLLRQARVDAEEYVGPVSADYKSGGLIDIVIKIPHNLVIVIENKINAGDQKHQLIRYKNAYPNAYLLYLTKYGELPSKFSTHDQTTKEMIVDFNNDPMHFCISYQQHILAWLNDAYEEILRLPLLRENLFQYITTIKKITNQSTDNIMANEIADAILTSESNLEGFFTLKREEVIKAVERKLLYKLIDETVLIAQKLGLEYDEVNSDRELGHKADDTEIAFKVPGTSFSLVYGFNKWRQDFCVGICSNSNSGEKDNVIKQNLSKRLSDQLGKDTDYPRWYYLLYMENSKHGDKYLSNWHEGSIEVWGKVYSGTVAERIEWYFKTFLEELKAMKLLPLAQKELS